MSEVQRRRWLVRTVIGAVVAVAVVVGGPWVYATFFLREAPEPLAIASTPSAPAQIPTGAVDIEGTWYVQEGSEAGYRLNETLSGAAVVVVGRTQVVSGDVMIADGMLTAVDVVVDAGSITTDESARDAYFRRALNTSAFPTATFTLATPVDVTAVGQSATPLQVAVSGALTLHGVSQPVTATLDVQRTVDGVELAGQLPVNLGDFDLTAPDLGWVVVEPTGTVEVHLVLARTAPAPAADT